MNRTFDFFTPAVAAAAVIGLATPAAFAQETFGNQGIRMDVDTVVEFEFLESNGSYQSVFGIVNLDTGEKYPLYGEVKGSDIQQSVNAPSDYQDDLGNQNRDDFHGTPGKTVPMPLGEFRFAADTDYTFYLESYFNGQPAGTLYSTSSLNPNPQTYAQFDGPVEDIIDGGLVLRWEDSGSVLVGNENTDFDYDDFIVRVGGHLRWDEPCGCSKR
ncbi:DUF4114 domain-containing protein [Leptothoe kymatousa]|uniref:Uncharacterized protein n=1 Tax=Leptothoe kymatousa TAU-MAC 1615 TaxID=2364775 RepID=A0ABS5Y3S7_9CYAN|nr:DUF4114 domain-containing protein [Leptothoe kymatousa]MBT9312480.1 hypothetical protein [Leptothoe kymatousa TAU-MAC 1615]